jgi:hypothetical protein
VGLSEESLASLDEAKTAIEDWQEQKIAEIESQAAFLRSVDVSISTLSESTSDDAVNGAQEIIDSILA